eukprot:jgi/Ulvmu1/2863/UM146_0005.1
MPCEGAPVRSEPLPLADRLCGLFEAGRFVKFVYRTEPLIMTCVRRATTVCFHARPTPPNRQFSRKHRTVLDAQRRCIRAHCVAGSTASVEPAEIDNPAPQSDVWELDFCSRPMVDVRGKKVWELLITEPTGSWVYAKYFPNNKINSTELKAALKEVLAERGAQKPTKVLFFRGQMTTIISRALTDMDIKAVPSRRCFTLMNLLEERLEQVYKKDERYSEQAGTMFQLDLAPPEDISDALRGEQWAFVQLPLSALMEEVAPVQQQDCFGAIVPHIDDLGLSPETNVPGVAVFSRRAVPLAAWTNGLEIACMKADTDRCCLLLEAGVRDRYRYGAWRRSPEATAEAKSWEQAKEGSKGLHFLAVQTDPEAEGCAGLWVMQERAAPAV